MASPCILVTGATGFLGPYVVAELRSRGCRVVTASRSAGEAAVDLTRPGMVDAVCEALRPDRAVNLLAMSRMADCELHPQRAELVNGRLPGELAQRLGSRLVQVSTDMVFDGRSAPYDERAPLEPLSVYGRTKAHGEAAAAAEGAVVVRLPLLFGPDERGRGATEMVRGALHRGERLALFTNEYRTPLHAADAAEALAEIVLAEGPPRLLHVAGPERVSRWELGRRFAELHGLDLTLLDPVECQDPLRPRDVSLAAKWPMRRSLAAMLQEG